MRRIRTKQLTKATFAPFGDVLDCSGAADMMINQGCCGRFHDRAALAFGDGRAGISLFHAQAWEMPYTLDLMERHPLGSQAFIPMHENPFLVIVSVDADGAPDVPTAFVTQAGQAVNIHQNIWHGVLTPLSDPGLFAVIDRIGDGNNLQEHSFDEPYYVDL